MCDNRELERLREQRDDAIQRAIEVERQRDEQIKRHEGYLRVCVRNHRQDRDEIADLDERLRAVVALADDYDTNGNAAELGDPCASVWHKVARQVRATATGE